MTRGFFRSLSLLASGLLFSLISCAPSNSGNSIEDTYEAIGPAHSEVIYGSDTRHELYQETDLSIRRLADSTVAVMSTDDLIQKGSTYAVKTENYRSAYGLCAEEPYGDEDVAAYCSGFLVAPDVVVTAGHCVSDLLSCTMTAFVFGFSYPTPASDPHFIDQNDVYFCKSVVHSEHIHNADFAVLKLDRPVKNHRALRLRSNGSVASGDPLMVIGYPAGLPLKIAGGAKVRSTIAADGFFVANTDTYGGNSGSPVFNSHTLEVEGILVRGETDFVHTDKGCEVSYVCPTDGCRGEDVMRIKMALPFIGAKPPLPLRNPASDGGL